MKFDKKIAVVVRDDLQTWQKLNVTAFTVSGIAGTQEVMGEKYMDGSGVAYLPMIKQPILVFSADRDRLKTIHAQALAKGIECAIYIQELFSTPNDDENRAAVRGVPTQELNPVGLALYGKKKPLDKILKGIELHG